MTTELKGVSNALAVFGAYGISLAEFTGAVDLPMWVGACSALAGTILTGILILIRLAEFRLKMAEARRMELENENYEHEREHTDTTTDTHQAGKDGKPGDDRKAH